MLLLAELVEEVKRLCAENPEFVYRERVVIDEDGEVAEAACFYTQDANGGGQGHGCLIGRALVNKGVPLEYMLKLDNAGGQGIDAVLRQLECAGLVEPVVGRIAMAHSAWLSRMQRLQDKRLSWGKCLATVS